MKFPFIMNLGNMLVISFCRNQYNINNTILENIYRVCYRKLAITYFNESLQIGIPKQLKHGYDEF